MATLKISNVHKSFGRTEVIRDVSLDVEDGELIVFVGPSGCGKSTMLRMIAGLEQLSAGEIQIGGRQVDHLPPARRGIAMVFQSYALYPHKDVRGNLGFALRHAGVDKSEVNRRVNEAAEILGLTDLMDRRPRELSGGQRQRVAIGRAIVREPDVFLFDEPLSNLDAALRVHMRVEILKLHQRLGNTMVYVTHDQVEAMTLADRIAVFRDGRVEQSGTPMELYRNPANDFVAGFIGSPSMNFLSTQWSGDNHSLSVAGNPIDSNLLAQAGIDLRRLESGETLKLGIRPEHLSLSDNGQFEGQVQVFENLGGESFVHINVGNDELLVAKLEGEHNFRPGDTCRLQVQPSYLHLFDQQGMRV